MNTFRWSKWSNAKGVRHRKGTVKRERERKGEREKRE
jgi:hypothetical protein